jgi:peptidoglycan/LPS O-acetylase OafA/YrhL
MKIAYRPEIDGLRAIAVIAVILYHAKVSFFEYQLFAGGFIGVDIFFVISGYLITSIILKEFVSTGSFSFREFYIRRIRRILPALLFVMLVSAPFAFKYLLPFDYIEYSKSIIYSIFFNSNFYFWYSNSSYGAVSSLLKPFLHTWSLSIEEQFYILFPIFLFVVFKFFKKYLIFFFIIGFILSLCLADWGSRNYPSFNFYILPTRAWELLAGSILAYFEVIKFYKCRDRILILILPIIGIILIFCSIFFFNDEILHPSFYSLPPIIGTCLIIWSSNRNEIVTKILSKELFVRIGLISYSLYLWHYPIFAFARVTEFYQDFFNKLLIGLILIIVSIFSYYFIEKPFRNKNYNFKNLFNIIIISIFILIFTNLYVISKNGIKYRVPEILDDSKGDPWELLKDSNKEICFNKINGCIFSSSSKDKVYMIGDSHMGVLTFDLKKKLNKNNINFITSTFIGCLYYPGFNLVSKSNKKIDKKCNNNYFQKLKMKLLKEKDSILIFGGRLPLHISGNKFDNQEGGIEGESGTEYISLKEYKSIQESFRNEVLKLSKKNKVILVYPIPELGFNPRRKIIKKWIKNSHPKSLNLESFSTSYEVYKKRTKESFDLLDSIKNKNIYRVYPHELFCNKTVKKRCIANNEKDIFYYDDDHLSLKGSQMVNDLIMQIVKKIINLN